MDNKSILSYNSQNNLDSIQLIVNIYGENIVTATNGKIILTAIGRYNTFIFTGMSVGTWSITANNETNETTEIIEIININETQVLSMFHNAIPVFTYTGNYEIVNDADNKIDFTKDNWKIRFLTSGTLKFRSLNGAINGIDIFLVGGGAGSSDEYGGGGGGYTITHRNISIDTNTEYIVTVAAGGNHKNNGNTSSFDIYKAAGGYKGTSAGKPGKGGSGGGRGWPWDNGYGGSGGSDGNIGGSSGGTAGADGQRASPGPNGETGSTREFGEEGATLYSGGSGGVGTVSSGAGGAGGGASGYGGNGKVNTGGAGGGLNSYKGGSGIIIIRNHRENYTLAP